MENIIRIENLTFEYAKGEEEPSTKAITDFSLEVKKGEFVAIIGRNGSGKSTLAKNLNGLYIPTLGKVFIKSWDTADEEHVWDVRQTSGMVFQNPDNQLVSSIVEEDIAFGPENLGVPSEEIKERVKMALEAVDMYKYRKKAPHLLSGGQKQRVAIAGVIAMNPECIIFDEPTAMLDPKGREEIMEIAEALHKRGITVILITHYMEEAARAERIVIMDKGRLLLQGTPEEVFKEEKTLNEVSLKVPAAVEIASFLREKGIKVPTNIISTEGLVDYVCQFK